MGNPSLSHCCRTWLEGPSWQKLLPSLLSTCFFSGEFFARSGKRFRPFDARHVLNWAPLSSSHSEVGQVAPDTAKATTRSGAVRVHPIGDPKLIPRHGDLERTGGVRVEKKLSGPIDKGVVPL